jgi:triacylglycerol lipase
MTRRAGGRAAAGEEWCRSWDAVSLTNVPIHGVLRLFGNQFFPFMSSSPIKTFVSRAALLPALGILLLSGCVAPLKAPPIQAGTANQPPVDFVRLAELARAAGNAYEPNAVIEEAYGKANVVIRDLPGSSGRYLIYVNDADRTQTIAIRGSVNKQNAWVDVDSLKVFDPRLKIFLHTGFKRATDELYTDAAPFLRNDYKTRITGHSLGGAMACIFMMDLLHDGVPVDEVVTFGQPRVTNEHGGRDFVRARYLRVINGQDLVAQAPPSNVVFDLSGAYEHFGPEITLQADGKWTYSATQISRDFVTNDNWKQVDLENATDHQVKNYIDRITVAK